MRENRLFSVISRLSGVVPIAQRLGTKTDVWRVKNIIIFALFCGLAVFAGAAEIYHTNRTFTAVQFDIQGTPTLYELSTETEKLTDIVKGTNIVIDTNSTYAIERFAVALGHNWAFGAWVAARNYDYERHHEGKIYDNVGWVVGTKPVGGQWSDYWGAYLWTMQNRIAFFSSETD